MAKVRVSFEVEIGDLTSYAPDDPPGISRENIVGFMQGLKLRALEQRVEASVVKDKTTRTALLKHYDDDVQLAARVMKSLVIEVIP